MGKLGWIATMGLSLILCAALAGCATPMATSTPTRTPAPTSTPTAPPTQTPVPTLTPTAAPTTTPVPTATPAATEPSTSTQPLTLTVEDLVGIWKTADKTMSTYTYIQFRRDGTLALAYTTDILEAGLADAEGQFSVQGDLLSEKDTICTDAVGVYRLESKTEGKLTFAKVEDDCKPPFSMTDWSLSRWWYWYRVLERVP